MGLRGTNETKVIMTLPKTYFFTDEVIDINLIIDNSKVPKVIKPFKVRLVATEYLDAP